MVNLPVNKDSHCIHKFKARMLVRACGVGSAASTTEPEAGALLRLEIYYHS